MTTVFLGGGPATAPFPRRRSLSRPALELLTRRTDTPLPWPAPEPAGARDPAAQDPCDPGSGDPADELAAAGLLHGDRIAPEVGPALRRFARPDVAAELTVSVPVPGGAAPGLAQLSTWFRLARGQVTAVSATAAGTELSWYDVSRWPTELTLVAAGCARAGEVASTPAQTRAAEGGLPRGLTLPLALVLAAGAAQRAHRPDLLAELAGRHAGRVSDDGVPLDVQDSLGVLHALHSGVAARLRLSATAAASPGRSRRLGLVSWVLLDGGWRALSPVAGGEEPLVAVRPVEPRALGAAAAHLAWELRP